MNYARQIFARLGLFAPKPDQAPDAFDLRLMRIGTRERRLNTRRALFRPKPAPLAA